MAYVIGHWPILICHLNWGIVSQHVLHVGGVCWISKDHFLQLRCANPEMDGDGKQIDEFLGVVSEQMCADDLIGGLVD